jgi:hypothetical protein
MSSTKTAELHLIALNTTGRASPVALLCPIDGTEPAPTSAILHNDMRRVVMPSMTTVIL